MEIVTITGVESPRGSDGDAAYCLDEPRPGTASDGYRLSLAGWVLGRRHAAHAVEAWLGERLVCRMPVDRHRPGIAREHEDVPWSGETGFEGRIGVLKLPSPFELRLRAVFGEERPPIPLATVRGERRPPDVDTEGSLQPILLTSLGRSGSTWVTRLLGAHPEVLAYRPFEYEARLSSYWLEIVGTLAEPDSYLQALRGHLSSEHWWIGAGNGVQRTIQASDPEGEAWLHRTQVETLTGFALGRIEAFYRRLAETEEKEDATRFVEKCTPQSFTPGLVHDLYPGAREVFLIRDFRDVVCSIFAFNRKRGYEAFGRDRAPDDASYVLQLRSSVMRLLDSWKGRADRAYLLRYEELMTRPAETLTSVLTYLGVDAGRRTVEDVLGEAATLTPGAQEQHRTSETSARSMGRWSRELSPELQETCLEAFGEALEAFGYEA